MFFKIENFRSEWIMESEATVSIFKGLTDDSLNIKYAEKVRSLGNLAWHITTSIPEMMNRTGLSLSSIEENSSVPQTAAEIIEKYKIVSDELLNALKNNWTDDSLLEKVNMYGEEWKKGKVLSILINHQIHHRAQMTIVMRLAGLKVHGVYGPASEEWSEMGMDPQN